jgi:hypothetical protein
MPLAAAEAQKTQIEMLPRSSQADQFLYTSEISCTHFETDQKQSGLYLQFQFSQNPGQHDEQMLVIFVHHD